MKILKIILVCCCILSATILVVEIIGRKIIPAEFIRLIGDADHRMKPFSEKDINEDGIRFRGNSNNLANKNVALFLGDSYTFGYRLRYRETIPQQFEKIYNENHNAPIQTVNFGWISSSPVLSNRLLRDIGEKYHPDTVFLLLDMTDFWDDHLYSQLLSGSLTGIGGKYLPATTIAVYQFISRFPALYELIYDRPTQRFFHSHQPLEKSIKLFDNTLQAINDIEQFTRETLHASFVLVVLPRNFQYSNREAPDSPDRHSNNLGYQDLGPYAEEPFRFFEKYREQVNFPILLLLEDFKKSDVPTAFSNDSHYNPAGARLAAHSIYEQCNMTNCLRQTQE